jgi:3'-5' exoribonuclease
VAELDEVRRLEPGSYDPADFLPAAYRSVAELEGFLEHLISEVHHDRMREVVTALLISGPQAAEFRRAPCTPAGHHAYLGGLLEHTVAIGTLVLETWQLHQRLNSDLLMAAALIHDIGKVREFTYGAEFGISAEGRLLGHLAIGAELIGPAAQGLGDDERLALLNCVLSHHGPEGSPGRSGRGRFGSPEALALYRINALDASVKGALETGAF